MKEAEVYIKKDISLDNPILVEGLPGLGLVGRLGAEHLIKELKAKKFAELYSPDFPPQVLIQPDATIEMRRNEFYYWKAKKKGQRDMIILIGDDQGLTVQSQYALCSTVIDTAENYKVKMLYTLGGYGMQKMVKDPRVVGAVTDKEMVREFQKHGVIFKKVSGHIMGAAGLLLGIGKLRGMKGICLMGETHGNYVDPRAARNVLEVVSKSLKLDIDLKILESKAKEVEEMITKLERIQREKEQPMMPAPPDEGGLTYIR